ncbi:two-component response regulator-like APRR9 [Silene latifolia]|uniref:two-component response regulator-like APRR9 n=1 Tax=Silene latifolia TaxID=37657 RepID=UPI003D76ADB0
MGEVVVSSFEGIEMENVEKIVSKEGSSSMIKWDTFLPKNGLRVLLVEADDSTRQIIGALLRKCSYKVATAPDGLKAWEVLKARPHGIDLILTEIELPSISGYALLTLIMEHEICKNIPVIMMSKYDSVSLVYKCMMRGAADFLVKPIRINELKNLWQHVWRRQSKVIRGGDDSPVGSIAQENLEATAENNATSDHLSGDSKACPQDQEDCLKKGSDAQSSCGKLELEGESAYTTEVESSSQPKQELSPVTELRIQDHRNGGSDTATYKGNRALDRDQRLEQERLTDKLVMRLMSKPPKQAIDLIGSFDIHSKPNSRSIDRTNLHDSSPHLDLCLTRCSPVVPENKSITENQMLNHSNASAFTRYVNRIIPTSNSNANSDLSPKDSKVSSGDLTNEAEVVRGNFSQNPFPIPLHKNRIQVDGSSTPDGYGSTMPPPVRTPSPSLSPSSANQQMNQNSNNPMDFIQRTSTNHPVYRHDQKLESFEDRSHFSDDTFGYQNGTDCSHEQSHGLVSQRSLQREAALNKFRLKRKERCFDKKVRYESRKKLAEQRPRVKGQFVRQVPPDPPPSKSDNSGGI